jgi:hypothetical protein
VPAASPPESPPPPECRACGRLRPAWSPPGRCPICGTPDAPPAGTRTDAEVKTDAVTEKFRLAARRAKGDF